MAILGVLTATAGLLTLFVSASSQGASGETASSPFTGEVKPVIYVSDVEPVGALTAGF